jgi:TPR repeat protein
MKKQSIGDNKMLFRMRWVVLREMDDNGDCKELMSLAEQGNAKAQNNLGMMFFKGKCVTNGIEDVEEAILWFKKSAEQGCVEAQFNLGLIFYEGKVVMQSNSEAMLWFKKAADQEYTPAQDVLKELGW